MTDTGMSSYARTAILPGKLLEKNHLTIKTREYFGCKRSFGRTWFSLFLRKASGTLMAQPS